LDVSYEEEENVEHPIDKTDDVHAKLDEDHQKEKEMQHLVLHFVVTLQRYYSL
jgi:hypothetical protein